MEFLQNLQENHSIVGGRRIGVTEDIIAEASGLPAVGARWKLKKERLQKVIEIFQGEGQSLTIKGKGVLPTALGEPWAELAKIVQSYITCEGRKDVVRARHLKLLAVLKGKCSVNLPALLNSLLHDAAQSLKKAQHTDMVVSHHGLIRLIISHNLSQQQVTWEELVEIVKKGPAIPPLISEQAFSTQECSENQKKPAKEKHAVPKRKRSGNTPKHLEKCKGPRKEKRVGSKRKQPSDTPERLEEPREPVGTPNPPERPRKSARLARIRGRLERIQKTAAQPIEIQDEPPEEQGELPEEDVKQPEAGADQPEEEIEEHDQSHREETIEQERENEQPMSSPCLLYTSPSPRDRG